VTERGGDFPEGELRCAFGAGRRDGRHVQRPRACQLRWHLKLQGSDDGAAAATGVRLAVGCGQQQYSGQ